MLAAVAVVVVPLVGLLTKCVMAQEEELNATSSSNTTTQKPDDSRDLFQVMNYTTVSDYSEYEDSDSGRVAGIVIAVIGGLALIGAVVAFCVYKQYVRRNVKSMNFDNPVYRKTTEDQFSLEKNQYQPTRSYPAVSEETLEPLTNPGTNEFV